MSKNESKLVLLVVLLLVFAAMVSYRFGSSEGFQDGVSEGVKQVAARSKIQAMQDAGKNFRNICRADDGGFAALDYQAALKMLSPHPVPAGYVAPDPLNRRNKVNYAANMKDGMKIAEGYRELEAEHNSWTERVKEGWLNEAAKVKMNHYQYLTGPEVQTILEVGAGTGGFGEVMAGLGKQVINLDVEFEYPYQHVIAERGLLGMECDGRGIYPFVERSFDAIHCYSVFHWFKPQEILMILDEWDRLLRPGGHVLLYFHEMPGQRALFDARVKAVEDGAGKLQWRTVSKEEFFRPYLNVEKAAFIVWVFSKENRP